MDKLVEPISLDSNEDLAALVFGEFVGMAPFGELCLRYDYPGLNPGEIFLLSRFPMTSAETTNVWAVYERTEDLTIENGLFRLNPFKRVKILSDGECRRLMDEGKSLEEIGEIIGENVPRTPDGEFHYGISLLMDKPEKTGDEEFVRPELYTQFDEALTAAGIPQWD
jgi:hypothetical protein